MSLSAIFPEISTIKKPTLIKSLSLPISTLTLSIQNHATSKINDDIVCFTDGACIGNQSDIKFRLAGWAAVFPNHPEYTISSALTGDKTNNRAELSAILGALKQANIIDPERKRTLFIYSDSELAINSLTKWLPNWIKKGWKKSDGSDVKNVDILSEIDTLYKQRKIIMKHVKAHTGNTDYESKWNNTADIMAGLAAK